MTWIKENGNKASNRDFNEVFQQYRGTSSSMRKTNKQPAKGNSRIDQRAGQGAEPSADGKKNT